jgi:signal transduction histidine kinase
MQITKGITESLYLERSSLQLTELKVKYDSERKTFENQHLKEEQQNLSKSFSFQKEFNLLLIFAISFIAIMLFYVYLINRKLKKVNTLLDSQNMHVLAKQAELEKLNNILLESERNLKDAQSTAQLANWELNPLNNQLTFSEQFYIIFNIPNTKSIGLEMILYNIHTDDKFKFERFFDLSEDNISENMIEVRLIFNNNPKWIKLKKIVMRNEHGVIEKLSGTVQDISDIKEEEEIKIQIAEQQSFTKQLIHYQEEERKRIAGDLHDGLGQNVLLIKNRALLGLQNDALDENLKKQFSEIDKLSSIVLDTTKEIAFNLRPAHLERLGLTDTIITTLEQSGATSKTDFKFNIEQIDNKLSKENEINLFRIIQEAVNNILKHSEASNALLEIKNNNDKILVTIADDGKGIENSKKEKSKEGFGLRNMMSRVQMLNGEIEIKSNDPKGTKIKISIPMEKL